MPDLVPPPACLPAKAPDVTVYGVVIPRPAEEPYTLDPPETVPGVKPFEAEEDDEDDVVPPLLLPDDDDDEELDEVLPPPPDLAPPPPPFRFKR
jgi:hypothetical protein